MNSNGDRTLKDLMWGRYEAHQDKRNRLALKAAHKALDEPDDEMNINTSRQGIGALGAVGIALGTGLPVAGVALAALLLGGRSPSVSTAPAAVSPVPITAPATPSLPPNARVHVETRYDPANKRHELRFRIYPDGQWSEWQPWQAQ